jgi:hypothetical protein
MERFNLVFWVIIITPSIQKISPGNSWIPSITITQHYPLRQAVPTGSMINLIQDTALPIQAGLSESTNSTPVMLPVKIFPSTAPIIISRAGINVFSGIVSF